MPQNTHALLVTDVVDSTRLTEELGDDKVAELWATHDRLARDLLREHKGREIDKTDGFLLLFDNAGDAVSYALGYRAALKDLGLQARAGLHIGEVVLRENSTEDVALGAKPLEVEGIAKPIAARVMSVAQGGQTLATVDAVDALDVRRVAHEPDGHVRGEGLLAVTHGHWMLKGVQRPVELFEIGVQGEAPFVPPPDAAKAWRVQWKNQAWVPVREVKHSLPRERDAFVGREEDLHTLADLLEEGAALVSVLGIGGTGKTRLVTHFGWTWLGSFPGGVWFCDLSEARSADGIVYAVAKALDVPLDKEPITQLGHAIAGRGRCLVILDNFEQVARHAQETLGRWLDRATEAQFVVTTREVLGLRGETSLALAPLEPAEGVELFVARARQAKRDFVADDASSIESLVTLLDSLPLAIELAAARVRLMAPKTLLERMTQRFRLLTSTGGRRDRQATLRGALDWSWDLLSEDEQAALAQVSVFEGGFTLEAAGAVLDLRDLWPEDAVQALLDKSLVRRVAEDRFDLLVSVQEYAAEKLEARGQREDAEVRHGQHFASFGTEDAIESLDTHGGVARRWALVAELDNLVAATRRAVAREDAEVATTALRAVWSVLSLCGPFVVGVELGTAVLGTDALPIALRASALQVLADALRLLGQGETAHSHYEEALAIHRKVGNRHAQASVLSHLGILDWRHGRFNEARSHHEEALAINRDVGNRNIEGGVLTNLGLLDATQGQGDAARSHFEEALAAARGTGNRRLKGVVLLNLGNLHRQQGRYDEAGSHYEEALAVARELGNRDLEGMVLGNLGVLSMAHGRTDEAHSHYEEALEMIREVGNRGFEGMMLAALGTLHMRQGRNDEACSHFEAAAAIHREVGHRALEGHALGSLGNVQRLLGRNDEARAAFDSGEVLLRAVEFPDELGKLLCGRAQLEKDQGHMDAAMAAIEEAEALATQVGDGPDTELGVEIAKARAALEA